MNIAQTRKYDVANGPGVRTTLFVSGCTHNCPGCFNKLYQDFDYGMPYTEATQHAILNNLADTNVKGLSVLGGEPFQNVDGLVDLLGKVRQQFPEKDIWIWSGYKYEELLTDEAKKRLLMLCDVLVDGKFIAMKKNLNLKFRGSSNQRIIDVTASLAKQQLILWEDANG